MVPFLAERFVAFFAAGFFALAGGRRVDSGSIGASAWGMGGPEGCPVSLVAVLIFFGTAISEWCTGLSIPTRFASGF